MAALLLNCRLNDVSLFERKHYFYADIPAGFQITQQRWPLANGGFLEYFVGDTVLFAKNVEQAKRNVYRRRTNVLQVQLEHDSGRSLHDLAAERTLVDLNRCGAPLVEVVTDSDLSSGLEALCFVKELQTLLAAYDVCDGKMELGHLRVDANVSVRRYLDEPLGERTEIKNINSVKFIQQAVDFEIRRHIGLLNQGDVVLNETRGYDAAAKKTVEMRDKEVKQDYRFMPEPNLPPLRLLASDVGRLQLEINGILPPPARNWVEKLGINPLEAIFIQEDEGLTDYFERCLVFVPKEQVATTLIHLFLRVLRLQLNRLKRPVSESSFGVDHFVELVGLAEAGRVTDEVAQHLIEEYVKRGAVKPSIFLTEANLYRIHDGSEITNVCSSVLKKFEKMATKAVRELTAGVDDKTLDQIVRKASRECRGRISVDDIRDTLKQQLLARNVGSSS